MAGTIIYFGDLVLFLVAIGIGIKYVLPNDHSPKE